MDESIVDKKKRIVSWRTSSGHTIAVLDDGSEYYCDTMEPFDAEFPTRPCTRCGKYPTPEGHDSCLGDLPGVEFACCGHGVEKAYISFKNGITIRGNFEVDLNYDEAKEKILEYIKNKNEFSVIDIVEELEIHFSLVDRIIDDLQKEEQIDDSNDLN